MKEVSTVGVVALNGDKVLLVKNGVSSSQKTGMYGLPAGKIDPGETEKRAAVREFQEETGLITTEGNLIPLEKPYHAIIEQKDGNKAFVWSVFLCSAYTAVLVNTDETMPEWVNIDNLPNLKLLPNVQDAVECALKLSLSI